MKNVEPFEWEDNDFEAKHMNHASDRFLDEAWGNHYVDYLEELGEDSKHIYAIDDIEEINDGEEYYKLVQKLKNGDNFQIEVWLNENGTYSGLSQVIL